MLLEVSRHCTTFLQENIVAPCSNFTLRRFSPQTNVKQTTLNTHLQPAASTWATSREPQTSTEKITTSLKHGATRASSRTSPTTSSTSGHKTFGVTTTIAAEVQTGTIYNPDPQEARGLDLEVWMTQQLLLSKTSGESGASSDLWSDPSLPLSTELHFFYLQWGRIFIFLWILYICIFLMAQSSQHNMYLCVNKY